MENTLRKYRAPLFADWGSDVSAALDYVAQLSSASVEGPAINTATRVVLNTVINAVDKMLASSSPEKLAIIELINDQINTWAEDKLGQIMDEMLNSKITYWMGENLSHSLNDRIDDWMDDNLGERMDTWAEDNLSDRMDTWAEDSLSDSLGDRIESWIDDNLGNKINDMDLVVRAR